MIWRRSVLAAVAGSLFGGPALAESEHVCTLGSIVREVEIRYVGDSGRPPCEVVYTKTTEAAGREEILWRADKSAGFCQARADELIDLLENNGWRCTAEVAGAAPAPPEATAAARSPEPRVRPAPPPAEAATPEPQVAGVPAPDAPLPPPERPEPPRVVEETAADVNVAAQDAPDVADELAAVEDDVPLPAAGPVDQPVRDLEQPEDGDDEVAGVGGVFIPAEALEAAVDRDLARLKRSAGDSVDAEVGSFGDLNGDDVDDAAVLITFDAEGNDHAQYLVAYVAEDGTYLPAASRFIGGRYRKIFGGDVTGIEGRRIRLQLQVLEPEDAYCCPSGTGSAEFKLENGELVEIR